MADLSIATEWFVVSPHNKYSTSLTIGEEPSQKKRIKDSLVLANFWAPEFPLVEIPSTASRKSLSKERSGDRPYVLKYLSSLLKETLIDAPASRVKPDGNLPIKSDEDPLQKFSPVGRL